jgi:hypothetical protein
LEDAGRVIAHVAGIFHRETTSRRHHRCGVTNYDAGR